MNQRLLMLGASEAQVVAIERAKDQGLYVVTADNIPGNPGHRLADVSYNVSTTDIEGIYEVAQKERVDAIISYASDPSALTAAAVADRLGLPGDPPQAVAVAQDKLQFRHHQRLCGHPVPAFADADDLHTLQTLWMDAKHGLVVKPADRAGSIGLHIFNVHPTWEELAAAIDVARSQSIKKKVIVESHIAREGIQFGCDYIFYDGKLLFASYADQYQHITESTEAAIGNLAPSSHKTQILAEATRQIEQIVTAIGLKSGIYNTDIRISGGKVHVLDFGARLGGNMLGEVHRLATGVDYTQAAIDIALGWSPMVEPRHAPTTAGHLVLHASTLGTLRHIGLSNELRRHVIVELRSKAVGDRVDPYRSTRDRLGIVVMQSDDRSALLDIYRDPIPHFNLVIDSTQQAAPSSQDHPQ